jgi:hypothetical protein
MILDKVNKGLIGDLLTILIHDELVLEVVLPCRPGRQRHPSISLERKTPSSTALANVKVYFVLLAMVTVVFCGVVVGAHYSQPLHNNVNVISVGAAKQRQHKLIAVI